MFKRQQFEDEALGTVLTESFWCNYPAIVSRFAFVQYLKYCHFSLHETICVGGKLNIEMGYVKKLEVC